MSSVLKSKKKKLQPKGYEDKFVMQKIAKDKTLSEKCFCSIFSSMQMINFTVLYYDFDFDKPKLQEFNKKLRKHNQEYDDKGISSAHRALLHLKNLNFDVNKAAKNFPYRPKMKMLGIRPKGMTGMNIALESVNGAIEVYLILALHTLHDDYGFGRGDVAKWWEKMLSVSELYVKGLDDDFIVQYFKEECDLDITM